MAKLAIHGDPLAVEAAAAFVRWGAEVWAAVSGQDPRAFGIGRLATFWQIASEKNRQPSGRPCGAHWMPCFWKLAG